MVGRPSGRKRVLVVDDDEEILGLYREILARDERLDVTTAATGYDAGLMTEAVRPDLILLDYMLPDVNGEIVCRRVRERAELQGCKVVCVSGMVHAEEIRRMMDAGADEFIKKPFDVRHLLERVQAQLGLVTRAAA